MSITDELKKWAEDNTLRDRELTTCPPQHVVRGVLETLLRIADRIDAEHDKALNSVDSAYDSGYNVGYDEGFASADDWLNQHEDAMAEHGWVRLPVDSDGVPIRVGDVMENLREDLEPSLHHRFTVYGIHYRAYGQECALTEDGYPSKLYRASETRHHHEPTVEDVLTEFMNVMLGTPSKDAAARIADYAAKLRLAGDAE